MNLTKKQLTKLKTKLALEGTGAKSKLAESLNLYNGQITKMLTDGICPNHASYKLIEYLK